MNVSDLFAALSYGELNHLSIGDNGAGTIAEAGQPKILTLADQTLTALYSRFAHNRDYAKLELQKTINYYTLSDLFAVSNTDVGNDRPRYIKDSTDFPFSGEFIRLLSIKDEDAPFEEGVDLNINDRTSEYGIQMVGHDRMYVKTPMDGNTLLIEYQTKHEPLSIPADLNQEITLIPTLEEALVVRVAAKVFAGIGGEDASYKSQGLFRQYEEICALAEREDLVQETSSDSHDKLDDKGFV